MTPASADGGHGRGQRSLPPAGHAAAEPEAPHAPEGWLPADGLRSRLPALRVRLAALRRGRQADSPVFDVESSHRSAPYRDPPVLVIDVSEGHECQPDHDGMGDRGDSLTRVP